MKIKKTKSLILAAVCALAVPALYSSNAMAIKTCVFDESGGKQTVSICFGNTSAGTCSNCSKRAAVGFANPPALRDGRKFRVCADDPPLGLIPIHSGWFPRGNTGYFSFYSRQGYSTTEAKYLHCMKACGGNCRTTLVPTKK